MAASSLPRLHARTLCCGPVQNGVTPPNKASRRHPPRQRPDKIKSAPTPWGAVRDYALAAKAGRFPRVSDEDFS